LETFWGRIYSDLDRLERVAEKVLEIDPSDSSTYVMMCNTYATAGLLEEENKWRQKMKSSGIKKTPGKTTGMFGGRLHTFISDDRSNEHGRDPSLIEEKLKEMKEKLLEYGHKFDTSWVTRLELKTEEEKIENLCHHSEKLAIAFGLIMTPPRETIFLSKNLRVCGDCHSSTKSLSRIYGREFVVRDANRFHHFKDGKCSCGDYF